MRPDITSRMRKFLIIVLSMSCLSIAGLATAVEPTVIALFGDSITVGRNNDHPDPTPPKEGNGSTTNGLPTTELRDLMLAHPKRTAIVANWGFGGSTSEAGQSRITKHLKANSVLYSGKAYYVLILYGANDFNGNIGASTTGFNIGLMIDKARQVCPVSTPTPVCYKPIIGTLTPRDIQLEEVLSRNVKIKQVAGSKGAFVVDHYSKFIDYPGGWEQLIDLEYSDFEETFIRLHPNDEGYRVIAQNWFDSRLVDLVSPDPVDPTILAPIISLLLDEQE